MGEIKSTLELAMEKTKKFAVSEREREEMKEREISRTATSLFHRYRGGHLSLNDLLKQIEKMERKTAAKVKQYLLSQWIDALSLEDEEEKILSGIESLEQRNIDEMKQKFQALVSQYREEKEKVKETVTAQQREMLKADGISGSAIEPNLEGNVHWKEKNEKLEHSYQISLDEIKERLRRYK